MRIGELAALVGVSTRTVRHYHHLGLLPEPERLPNGYREYRLRDAVLLSRVRQLAALGLSLDELRDVLADDAGKELREVLEELDADLARQQAVITLRREKLAELLRLVDLNPDSLISPDLTTALRDLSSGGSRFAALDRELLTLVGSMAGEEEVRTLLAPLTSPDALAKAHELYARLDALDDAEPGDPRIAALAADLADYLPAEMTSAMAAHSGPGSAWLEALTDELNPAQAEVFRLLLLTLKEGL
ncbi:MerR family transcriptional regulator [Nonomuraea dietziae]|uniref:DNA-binding transcriptional MerR regulator n=1 Tax=Nonomuraea dietziae TaxID=65515 RepID=A0A7W5VGH8_9ACTN|nr:MerR family transcriptional regulator [Nonomuraea dietziae]MBB3727352.1 DNA-binding transcriptional MerR regulator [Nonomuraea dietziae]